MKVWLGFWIALSMMVVACAEAAGVVALTEQQAIALFYERNLDLIAAQYNVDQAQADRIVAAAIPNPVLTVNLYELNPKMLKDGNSRLGPALSPQIQQLIETAGKRRLRMESSELGSEAAELDLQDTVRVLTNAVRRAYYALLLAQKTFVVARDNADRYTAIGKSCVSIP